MSAVERPRWNAGDYLPRADTRMTIREVLAPVFFHRWLAIIAFAVPVTLAFLAALLSPVSHIADAKLLILLGKDYVFQGDNSSEGQAFDRNQIVQAEMEILGSRDLHVAALNQVGLKRLYPDLAKDPRGSEKALLRLEKDLSIQNVPQSNVIEIQFRNRDANSAIDLVNSMDDIYVARRKAVFAQATLAELEGQKQNLFYRLTAFDNQIAAISQNYQFGDYGQAVAAAQTDQSNLTSHVQSLDEQLAAAQARNKRLHSTLTATPASKPLYTDKARSQQVQDLTSRLLDLQAQRREAASRYAEGYPLLVDLDQRIADVRKQLDSTPADQVAAVRVGDNPIYESLDSAVTNAQGDIAGLQMARTTAILALNQATQRLAQLTGIGPGLHQLMRNRDVLEAAYTNVSKRAEDTRLSDSLANGRANVRIIQPAANPTIRKTSRLPLAIAGLGAGLVACAATVLLASNFRQTMLTSREAQARLGIPVLLSIQFSTQARIQTAPVPLLAPQLLTLEDCLLILRLATENAGERSPVIQFISGSSGSGVSSLAVDFASHLSSSTQGPILLMDVEPPQDEGLIKRLTAGGAKVMTAGKRHVHPIEDSKLYVSEPAGARELVVSNDKWENVLGRARNFYSAIVLDTPPPSRSAAGLVIAPFADLILLVVEAEQSRVAPDLQLLQRLDGAGGRVTGLIFNKRRNRIPKPLYSVS